jgi:hypothetical protein
VENLFDQSDRSGVERRLRALTPDAERQWGRMTPSQMLAHCSVGLEYAIGTRTGKQALLGRLVTPFIRSRLLGERPFAQNAPTGPDFRVTEERDFEQERARLSRLIDRFFRRGAVAAAAQVHPFFGRLSGEEWGRLTFKHLDHHLRQFGV